MSVNLEDCLTDIARLYALDANELIAYAFEDNIGGWDEGRGGWPIGSVWSVEGKVLYALVRALKPTVCVELGTYHGCSATHIAAALHANGGTGRLYCVENGGYGLAQPDLVPQELQGYMTFFKDDAALYMESANHQIDFIFEDSAHNQEITQRVWQAAKAKLAPGGIIISHDAMHFNKEANWGVGPEVRKGIVESGVQGARFYLVATPSVPSDCGFAIWQAPKEYKDGGNTFQWKPVHVSVEKESMITPDGIESPIVDAPPVTKEKPKRTRVTPAPKRKRAPKAKA